MVNVCAACGTPVPSESGASFEQHLDALLRLGWLSMAAGPLRERGKALYRHYMCPACLREPSEKARALLVSWSIPPDAFMPQTAARNARRKAARPPSGGPMGRCSACHRWLEKNDGWTFRVGSELRESKQQILPNERKAVRWYCERSECQTHAKQVALKLRQREGNEG